MWRNYVLWLRETLRIAKRDEEVYPFEDTMAALVTGFFAITAVCLFVILFTIIGLI